MVRLDYDASWSSSSYIIIFSLKIIAYGVVLITENVLPQIHRDLLPEIGRLFALKEYRRL